MRAWLGAALFAAAVPAAAQPAAAQPAPPVRAEVVRRSRVDTVGNSYRAYLPPGRARGLLVLLPGYGSNVDSYELGNGYTPSGLPARLAARGIATAAGACGGNPPVAAVFAVGAPLDFAPVWREADLSIRRGSPRANLDEARGLLEPARLAARAGAV